VSGSSSSDSRLLDRARFSGVSAESCRTHVLSRASRTGLRMPTVPVALSCCCFCCWASVDDDMALTKLSVVPRCLEGGVINDDPDTGEEDDNKATGGTKAVDVEDRGNSVVARRDAAAAAVVSPAVLLFGVRMMPDHHRKLRIVGKPPVFTSGFGPGFWKFPMQKLLPATVVIARRTLTCRSPKVRSLALLAKKQKE